LDWKVPEVKERYTLLQKKHLLGHFGAEAIVQALRDDGLTWPTMKKEAIELVKQCQDCQRFNITKYGFHPLRSIHAELPGDHWAIDLAGPLVTSNNANHYLLVMVDIATRFVILRAIPDKQAVTIAQQLFRIFCDFGFPKVIQSDNGTEFVNRVIKKMVNIVSIDHRLITPYHPRANSVAERYVQTTVQAIQKQVQGTKKDWDLYVPAVQFAVNTKIAAIHGSTPFSLMFGRQINSFQDHSRTLSKPLPISDLKKRIDYLTTIVFPSISAHTRITQDRMINQFNKKIYTQDILFPDGSYVMILDMIRRNKLDPKYEGPFKIMRQTKEGSYILQDNDGSLLP